MKPTTDTLIHNSQNSVAIVPSRNSVSKRTRLSTNWRGVSDEAKEEMKKVLVEAYNPDIFLTLETFGSDTGATSPTIDTRKQLAVRFIRRLANSSKQHIRYTMYAERCPTSNKIHLHLTLTYEKRIIPVRQVEKLWLCMVMPRVSKKIENSKDRLSSAEWLDLHKEGKWKSNFAVKSSTKRSALGEQLFYGWRKDSEFADGTACPKRGSCRHRSCWLITDDKWKEVLVRRNSNE
jgi:hypothetical protein